MPELIEQMYCSQQIVIPPKFPYILKRYAKAAIKTQPYDLLRWSFEYFEALAQNRPPPVKLRLEYPVFSTEGGLTRGYLRVLAHQLEGMDVVPLHVLRKTWRGSCLDMYEMYRILCLCEIFMRHDSVPRLDFIAVAGGLLTKSLTQTMILLCETLTKEPDGGSAAIPVDDFLSMYEFLARIDASKDFNYYDGYREGAVRPEPPVVEEEEATVAEEEPEVIEDEYWQHEYDLHHLTLIDDNIATSTKVSESLKQPIIGPLERDPSVERAALIDREAFLRGRKGKIGDADVCRSRDPSSNQLSGSKEDLKDEHEIEIIVNDEDGNILPLKIYGEPKSKLDDEEEIEEEHDKDHSSLSSTKLDPEQEVDKPELNLIDVYVNETYQGREERRGDLERTFDEMAKIVDRYKSANYDYGMVAGRQMSTTSAEFIVSQIERDILEYIDEQIAILPDPDLKKKKAKPEEMEMIKELVEQFISDNMHIFVPEIEEVEEEEAPLPEVTRVFAVPGIGPPVEESIIEEFREYALKVTKSQANLFMPRNIRHFLCPMLEKYEEHDFEGHKEEKIPIGGGVLTE